IRPFNPFCGTVSKAQLAALYGKASPNGVVIRQLSFRPPASSSATDVAASSDSRPANAQPPAPAPTTTKSNVSVTDVSPALSSFRGDAEHRTRNLEVPGSLRAPERPPLRHEPHQFLQPRDLAAIGRIEVGEAIEL